MKHLILTTFVACSFFAGFGQPNLLNALSIPDSLKKDAHAVKLHEEITFEITAIDRAKHKVLKQFVVYGPNADNALRFVEYADKAQTLEDVEIRVYDMGGRVMNKYKKKDIYKQADLSGVAGDNVFYSHYLKPSAYPVIVEYNYEVSYTGLLYYPSYYIMNENESVLSSTCTVKVPADLDIRYKAQHTMLKPDVSQEASSRVYRWTAKNLKAIKYEERSVYASRYYPAILLAPTRFKIYNSTGEMTTWQKFGEWEQKLCAGLEVLPEERVKFFADMVKGASSEREKVATVYNYLQKNFRYVSIQLGIGGWQPFPAKFTDEKKYGDCKALSFYMHSVLKAIGIRSHVAIINSGFNTGPADPDFPLIQFNHMVLCVPQAKDSIWLECTSQVIDFDYLSADCENKNAVLVTEKGGVLVSTPKSDPKKNQLMFLTNIHLSNTGSGTAITKIGSTGEYRADLIGVLADKKDHQKEYVTHYLGFKQPDVFELSKNSDSNIQLDLTIEKIPEFTAGSKMFLRPRLNRVGPGTLPPAENRTRDYYFRSPMMFTDTTVFHLPEGYIQDAFPKEKNVDNEYVLYQTRYWYDSEKKSIYSAVLFSIRKNLVPAANYAEVKKLFDEVAADGAQKIVIKKG